jgi:hypothetical protein
MNFFKKLGRMKYEVLHWQSGRNKSGNYCARVKIYESPNWFLKLFGRKPRTRNIFTRNIFVRNDYGECFYDARTGEQFERTNPLARFLTAKSREREEENLRAANLREMDEFIPDHE